MLKDFSDLRSLEFVTLSEAKARLSEFVRRIMGGAKRLMITTNGHPTAVLLSYRDYLALLDQRSPTSASSDEPVIRLEDWRRGSRQRATVRDSILKLFDPKTLSRKGQKSYKKQTVESFER